MSNIKDLLADTMEKTEIHTWFERDRAHVELRDKRTDETIYEWWDEAVDQAIQDGFLDASGFVMGKELRKGPLHESACAYVMQMVRNNKPLPDHYEVIVGNIGTVYDGFVETAANHAYNDYVTQSKSGIGRAGNETVTLMRNGDIAEEYYIDHACACGCGRGEQSCPNAYADEPSDNCPSIYGHPDDCCCSLCD